MIPERAANRTSPLQQRPDTADELLESPEQIDRSDEVSSTLSLPLSISSDRDIRSGSAATVSTSPSSPIQDHEVTARDQVESIALSKESTGYMNSVMNSSKIHPDIVPIYQETSVRLDQMNQVSFFVIYIRAY